MSEQYQRIAEVAPPRDHDILLFNESTGTYAVGVWVQNPYTGHESWQLARLPDGSSVLFEATHWRDIPKHFDRVAPR